MRSGAARKPAILTRDEAASRGLSTMRICISAGFLAALAAPAFAANTPQQLAQELTRAAHESDVEGLLSATTANTRRAFADADAVAKKLIAAQRDFLEALSERFGSAPAGGGPSRSADRKTALSRFVDIELVNVEHKSAHEAQLRLKTTAKDSMGQASTEEDVLPAVQEHGQWKLDLKGVTEAQIRTAAQRAAVFEQLAKEVRSNAFKDRISALAALLRAQRGGGGTTEE